MLKDRSNRPIRFSKEITPQAGCLVLFPPPANRSEPGAVLLIDVTHASLTLRVPRILITRFRHPDAVECE